MDSKFDKEFNPGEKVLACFGETEDFHENKEFHKYKTQIGEIVTVGYDYLYVNYNGVSLSSPKRLFSPVKIIYDASGDEIYRINNSAGGHTYLGDIGFGVITLYDTCLNDETTMLLILSDVAQERRKKYYDKLRRKHEVQHGGDDLPASSGILQEPGDAVVEE